MPSLSIHLHQNILLLAVTLGLGGAQVEAKGVTAFIALLWCGLIWSLMAQAPVACRDDSALSLLSGQ